MIIEFKPHDKEKVEWREVKNLLAYLSKKFDVIFRYKLGDWEIYATPKCKEIEVREKQKNE